MEVDFFYAHILRIKTMIGQNKLTVKLNITPFEYIKLDRPIAFSRKCVKSNMARVEVRRDSSLFCKHCCQNMLELKKGLKFTLKEEPKTAVKHLFGERYLVAVLCNVRIPLILPLVRKSHGLKPGSGSWPLCSR